MKIIKFGTKLMNYLIKNVDLDTIHENVLAIMEGMAASYEEQSSNDMNIMEGLAAIYEEQIGGTQ